MSDIVRAPAEGVAAVLTRIFAAAGGSEPEARGIADNLVEATLSGHDSHGVIRTQRYVEYAQDGHVFFGRSAETIADGGALTLLDGKHGFGQTIGREATELGIARAKAHGVAVVGLRNVGHLGRIGAWAETACAQNIVSMHFVNGPNSALVAPFGGAERRYSTSPYCVGVPNKNGDFILDFATSQIAEGKALVAMKGGAPAPHGSLIDAEGRPTSDPNVLYGDVPEGGVPNPRLGPGALAPMGLHKGSGLALACELLGGALTGGGYGSDGGGFRNGMLSIYLDPDRLRAGDAKADWSSDVEGLMDFVRSCAPAADVERVMVAGDPERQRRAERGRDGLPLPAAVWESILTAGDLVGLERAALIDVAGLT